MPEKQSDTYELKNALALSIMPGVGDVYAKNLISYCGGLDAVFKESLKALSLIPGIGVTRARAIKNFKEWKRVEEEMKFMQRFDIQALFYLDKGYPQRLKPHTDSPIVMFKRGEADLNSPKMVSVVGTRKATKYGKSMLGYLI